MARPRKASTGNAATHRPARTEDPPDRRAITRRQAAYLAEETGVEVEKLVSRPIAELDELLRWKIDPFLLLFRRVCGRVVRRGPGDRRVQGVPNATVHVEDTDCSFLGFFPVEGPFIWWWWFWPISCHREEIATTMTDECGRSACGSRAGTSTAPPLPLERVCFPEIYKPTLRDVLTRSRSPVERPPIPPTPNPPDPAPFVLPRPGDPRAGRRAARSAGRSNASRSSRNGARSAQQTGEMTALLDGPALLDGLPRRRSPTTRSSESRRSTCTEPGARAARRTRRSSTSPSSARQGDRPVPALSGRSRRGVGVLLRRARHHVQGHAGRRSRRRRGARSTPRGSSTSAGTPARSRRSRSGVADRAAVAVLRRAGHPVRQQARDRDRRADAARRDAPRQRHGACARASNRPRPGGLFSDPPSAPRRRRTPARSSCTAATTSPVRSTTACSTLRGAIRSCRSSASSGTRRSSPGHRGGSTRCPTVTAGTRCCRRRSSSSRTGCSTGRRTGASRTASTTSGCSSPTRARRRSLPPADVSDPVRSGSTTGSRARASTRSAGGSPAGSGAAEHVHVALRLHRHRTAHRPRTSRSKSTGPRERVHFRSATLGAGGCGAGNPALVGSPPPAASTGTRTSGTTSVSGRLLYASPGTLPQGSYSFGIHAYTRAFNPAGDGGGPATNWLADYPYIWTHPEVDFAVIDA